MTDDPAMANAAFDIKNVAANQHGCDLSIKGLRAFGRIGRPRRSIGSA